MNGINLIPVRRLETRRRAARARLWLSIAPVCISALAGSFAYVFASTRTDSSDLTKNLEQTDATIKATQKEISAGKGAIAETMAMLRASQAVADQPDWGVLLTLLSQDLGDEVVLSTLALEPIAAASEGADPARPAPTLKAASHASGSESPRPQHYRLGLSGLARTQEAVPALVRKLQDTALFDRTTMLESIRSPFMDGEAFKFRIECSISDSAEEAR